MYPSGWLYPAYDRCSVLMWQVKECIRQAGCTGTYDRCSVLVWQVKECIRQAGGITLLARLLQSVHTELLISVMGIIQMCASEVRVVVSQTIPLAAQRDMIPLRDGWVL